MSTFTSSDLVLVTGANGHVAQHLICQLLALSPRVRGTVRSTDKVNQFKEVFPKEHETGRLEIVVVPEITVDGAFDAAIKGTSRANFFLPFGEYSRCR